MIEEGQKQFVIVGQKRSEPFDRIVTDPVFSPDSSKVAFGALKDRELWWKVISVP